MNFIEELYYGNINPNEKRYKKATPYDKALSIFTTNEDKLKEALSGEYLKLYLFNINYNFSFFHCIIIGNFCTTFRLIIC